MPLQKGQKQRKFTQKEKQEALEAIASGMTVPQVAKAMDINDTTIRYWLKIRGIAPISAIRSYRDAAITLYKGGRSMGEIAKTMGISKSTIRSWIISEGVVETPEVAEVPSALIPESSYRLTVDDFIKMMKELIADYERLKEYERHTIAERESWKKTAGKLQEQLNTIAASMSLR